MKNTLFSRRSPSRVYLVFFVASRLFTIYMRHVFFWFILLPFAQNEPMRPVLGYKSISFHLSCDDFTSWRCHASLSTRLLLVFAQWEELEGNKWKKTRKTKRKLDLFCNRSFHMAPHPGHSHWAQSHLIQANLLSALLGLVIGTCQTVVTRYMPDSDTETLPNFWGISAHSIEPCL